MTPVKTILLLFFAVVTVLCGCSGSSVNAGPGSACGVQADCARGQVCMTNFCVEATSNLYSYEDEIHTTAQAFLESLKARQLNVVTAESLTSGMIVSSLIDVPLYGAYVYGGFATYDSDAKRQFLGVKVGDVYTKECSLEMAAGALTHSRALVGVAVTGKAGPVTKTDLDNLGVVDVAVSIRTDVAGQGSVIPNDASFPQSFTTAQKRINNCGVDGHQWTRDLCEKYKIEATEDKDGRVSAGVLNLVRKLIRQDTVIQAVTLGKNHLETYQCEKVGDKVVCPNLSGLCIADYDGIYSSYGDPSWVIAGHSGTQICK